MLLTRYTNSTVSIHSACYVCPNNRLIINKLNKKTKNDEKFR